MVITGDCREMMPLFLADGSVDAIVTDPPYELGFMGHGWDKSGIAYDSRVWAECLRVLKPGGHLLAFGATRTYHRVACAIQDVGFEIRDCLAWMYGSGFPKSKDLGDGWGTCLKPAFEPIVMARKPFQRTATECHAEHGTAGLNIEGCRVGTRFPANLIHDGSDEVLSVFPDSAGSGGSVPDRKVTGYGKTTVYRGGPRIPVDCGSGSAARFFYCAKVSKKDRDEGLDGFKPQDGSFDPAAPRRNPHPTVKPTDLMRYLCRLVTPAGGLVVDPFTGSGSTGKAAVLEGFNFLGFELDPYYAEISRARIERARP